MRTEKYQELKNRHGEEIGGFEGLFFAFDNKQFEEGMEKVGLKVNQTGDIFSIGAGGYILKSRSQAFHDMLSRHAAELKTLLQEEKALLTALVYELQNHEYCITYDITEALESLGLEEGDIDKEILKKACKEALQTVLK